VIGVFGNQDLLGLLGGEENQVAGFFIEGIYLEILRELHRIEG